MAKHKTKEELLYGKLVINLICNNNIPPKEKNFLLFNFLSQSEFYYDVFCESVYQLMTDDVVETVSLDDSGYARSNLIRLDDYYIGFELLSKKDVASSEEDVIVYIKLALERLQNRLVGKCFSLDEITQKYNCF